MSHSCVNFRQTEFLEGLPEAESKQLAGMSELRAYKDGEMLFSKGEKLQGVFVVAKGSLKIFRTSTKEKIQVLDRLKPGQCIGDAQIFSDGVAASNAVARGDTECWLVPRDALRRAVKENQIVSEAMLRHLSKKVLHIVSLVETLSLHTVTERVAQMVVECLNKTPDRNFVEFIETQEELANHIGASREAFNRALRQLGDLGIIQNTFPVVRVTDHEKLLSYSKG
jgi:CRP/FNR family transcriptional regulator